MPNRGSVDTIEWVLAPWQRLLMGLGVVLLIVVGVVGAACVYRAGYVAGREDATLEYTKTVEHLELEVSTLQERISALEPAQERRGP